jgi:hypothetical protein
MSALRCACEKGGATSRQTLPSAFETRRREREASTGRHLQQSDTWQMILLLPHGHGPRGTPVHVPLDLDT